MNRIFLLMCTFVLSITPFLLLSRTLFLRDPLIWPDEAIFTDSALSLAKTGSIATNLFGDLVPGLSSRALWYPPLYFHILSRFTRVFGTTIEAVRAFSLLTSVVTLGVFFFIIWYLYHSAFLSGVATFLLSFDTTFGAASRIGRMDALSMLFIISAIGFYLIAQRKYSILWYIAVGITCGLSIVTHPLGLIAPTVIAINVILTRKKGFLRHGLAIAVPIILFIILWILSMINYLNLFIVQYKLQFDRKAGIYPSVVGLFAENRFWTFLFVTYGVIAIIALYTYIRYRDALVRFFLVGLVISSVVLSWGRENWYIVYFQPFLTLLVITLLVFYWKRQRILFGVCVVTITSLILLHGGYTQALLESYRGPSYDYHAFTKKIGDLIDPQATILLATIPDPYFDLRRRHRGTIYEFPTVPVRQDEYNTLLYSVDVIIINTTPDEYLHLYAMRNALKVHHVKLPSGYETNVVTLVPRERRI